MNAARLLTTTILLGCALPQLAAAVNIVTESATTQVRVTQPGESYRGHIALHNIGTVISEAKLYSSDYSFSANGHSEFGAPGRLPRSNAGWLQLSQEQVRLAPGERAEIDYEVRVPQDARLTGTYWSAVAIEEAGGPESAPASKGQVQVRQVVRRVVQIITEIGETGKGEVAFRDVQLIDEAGKRILSVDLENTGERWLQTNIWLDLRDAQGKSSGRFQAPSARTFPGTSVRNRIDLSSAAPGKYQALLVADGGHNDLFGAQVELDIR